MNIPLQQLWLKHRYELPCNLAYEIPCDDMWAGNELDKVTAVSAHLNRWCTNKTELLKKAHVKFFPAFLAHGITVRSVLNSYTFFWN